MLATGTANDFVETALTAFRGGGGSDWRSTLDELPVPVYTTDSEGAVTYWNQACVDFAGREPKLGSDQLHEVFAIHRNAHRKSPYNPSSGTSFV